jgi:hypothetical protein
MDEIKRPQVAGGGGRRLTAQAQTAFNTLARFLNDSMHRSHIPAGRHRELEEEARKLCKRLDGLVRLDAGESRPEIPSA